MLYLSVELTTMTIYSPWLVNACFTFPLNYREMLVEARRLKVF